MALLKLPQTKNLYKTHKKSQPGKLTFCDYQKPDSTILSNIS